MILFRIVILFLALIAAGVLGGCSKPEPVVHVVTVNAAKELPEECEATDPAWINLPDGEARRSTVARNYRANKDQYDRLLGARQICRSAVRAAKSPRPAK